MFSDKLSEGLRSNDEHLAELGAEGVVLLILVVVLGLVKVAGQLDEVVGDVGLDGGLDVGDGRESCGPALKSGDIVAEVSAILNQIGQFISNGAEVLDSSLPMVAQEVFKGMVSGCGLGLYFAETGLDLSEILSLNDAVSDTCDDCVVLVRGQVTDGRGGEVQLKGGSNVLDCVHKELSVHSVLLSFSYLILIKFEA